MKLKSWHITIIVTLILITVSTCEMCHPATEIDPFFEPAPDGMTPVIIEQRA